MKSTLTIVPQAPNWADLALAGFFFVSTIKEILQMMEFSSNKRKEGTNRMKNISRADKKKISTALIGEGKHFEE